MMTALAQTKTQSPGLAVWKAVLLILPIALLSSYAWLLSLLSGESEPLQLASFALAWLAFNVVFVLMLTTGKTHRYRSALFILIAVALPLEFIPWMIKTYGSMMLTDDIMYSGGASFCPLTMPMVIIPALLKRVVIFPGELLPTEAHGAFAVMFIFWVGASLALGRGWCSWGCLYGGWDELFSRLRKRPLIKHQQIDRRWIYLPFGILLAIVLLSAITFSPIYCEWLCPFKVVTEFAAPTSLLIIVQTVIFVALFIGLVIVLPLLSKRRIQCGLFCPFGAMQSLLNKINVFEVRIDPDQCSQCQQCIRTCPTFSLDKGSLESGKPLITCTKCTQCIDACPKSAASLHIKGTPLKASPAVTRVLFLYPAFLLLAVLGLTIVGQALWRIIKLITTGSML
jgi:ferredoxin-type protein NapH